MGMADSSVKKALMAQGKIILVNYVLTFISLLFQRPVSESIRSEDNDGTAVKTGNTDLMAPKSVPNKPPLFL